MNFFTRWKTLLSSALGRYESYRDQKRFLFLRLFVFFLVVNISCYWLGISTAFPHLVETKLFHMFKIQWPVALLGALFDSVSFFLTIWLIRKAIKATTFLSYLGVLSIDLIIASVATAWVLFVFLISSWMINTFFPTEIPAHEISPPAVLVETPAPAIWQERKGMYERVVIAALKDPLENWHNIYFGLVMGLSTLIPTFFHLILAFLALIKTRD